MDCANETNKKVLVVEDDAAISGLLTAVMELEGLEALPAYDGEMAVRLAHSLHPDLITLDLALPKKDGHEVLRALEAEEDTRTIPIIVVSAYTNRLTPDDTRHVAFVVGKPFDVDDLVGKVKRVLAHATP